MLVGGLHRQRRDRVERAEQRVLVVREPADEVLEVHDQGGELLVAVADRGQGLVEVVDELADDLVPVGSVLVTEAVWPSSLSTVPPSPWKTWTIS